MKVPRVSLEPLGYMGWQLDAPEALNMCLDQRNKALQRARQYRDVDLPWFKAHDPAEYEMQIRKDVVAEEVKRAWMYHRWAMRIHDMLRTIPKQQSLFEVAT